MTLFAQRLKELRKNIKFSQAQLAKSLKVTPQCICRWEKEQTEPNFEMLISIAKFFGVSTDFLLGL